MTRSAKILDRVLLLMPLCLQIAILIYLANICKPSGTAPQKTFMCGMTVQQFVSYQRSCRKKHEAQYELEAPLLSKLSQVKVGMNIDDVRSVLGTPVSSSHRNIQQRDFYTTDTFGRESGMMGDDFKILVVVFNNSKLAGSKWSMPNIN